MLAVIDIRYLGLMIGIELDQPCAPIVNNALEQGLLLNVTADSVVRLLPPLILSNDEADQVAEQVALLINHFTTTNKEESRS